MTSKEEIKKNQDKLFGTKKKKSVYEQRREDLRNSRSKNDKKEEKKVTSIRKLSGKERAQALAKKNIKKYGGTASAAAANKEAMRLKIKKKYLASKKKK